MDFTLRELECFLAVAEELSFTRAAQRLNLAQPPLSRHVRTLEERVGTALFVRSSRRVALTSTGAALYEEAAPALARLRQAGESARRAASGRLERLRIGFVSAVLSPDILQVFKLFRDRRPDVHLIVEDIPPAEQLVAISQGKLDGGFVGLKPSEKTPGVTFIPWARESLVALVPSGHSLAHAKSCTLKQLRGEPLIAVSSRSAPAFSVHVRELCRRAGFRPHIVLESPRAQAVAVMVAAGAGIAILPESLARIVGDAAAPIRLRSVPDITHVFARISDSKTDTMNSLMDVLASVSKA